MKDSYEKFDQKKYKTIAKRIVEVIEAKIQSLTTRPTYRKPNETVKWLNRTSFFKDERFMYDFPMSSNTYYKYTAFGNDKATRKEQSSMGIGTFYDICEYTNASADYLLGFTDTNVRTPSAKMVKEEFGLSDKAMTNLLKIKNRETSNDVHNGSLTTALVSFILENEDFLYELDELLPIYYMIIYEYRSPKREVDIARYSLINSFEKLLNDIGESYYNIKE